MSPNIILINPRPHVINPGEIFIHSHPVDALSIIIQGFPQSCRHFVKILDVDASPEDLDESRQKV